MVKPELLKPGKPYCVLFAVIALLIVQTLSGKAGGAIAGLFSYESIDPDNVFAWQSVHHLIILFIGLTVVAGLSRLLKDNFGFQPGDRQKGMRYFIIFTAALTIISLIFHTLMYGLPQRMGDGVSGSIPLHLCCMRLQTRPPLLCHSILPISGCSKARFISSRLAVF